MNRDPEPLKSSRIRIVVDPDLRDLIPGFLANRRNDIRRLHIALAGLDFETARTLGHRMRGDGGGYGFEDLSTIGSAIERAARNKDIEAIARSVEDLTSYLDRIEVVDE